MRIGELAKQNNVTIDTIRYYISLGLLIPRKKGSQFEFNQRETENLQFIQRLKSMRFNLKEIGIIMNMRRTGNWNEPETIKEYTRMLRAKIGEINAENVALEYSKELIEKEISCFEKSSSNNDSRQGVPIRALPYLVCPHCGRQLTVNNGTFSYKYIHDGELLCESCGYRAKIEKGIILTGNRYEGHYDTADIKRELYHTLNSDLLKIYQLLSDHILMALQKEDISGKIIMENFVNGYFFLYTHFHELPKDCLYIIVDKYPEMIYMYKELISALGLELDILYIADASLHYPLAKGCVDVVVDFFSSNEHDFYFKDFYYDSMNPYLKENVSVFGATMALRQDAKSRRLYEKRYPEGNKDLMMYPAMEENLKKNGFQISNKKVGSVKKSQNMLSFSCHLNGEEMSFLYFEGHRREK